jgi:hypothetical protein
LNEDGPQYLLDRQEAVRRLIHSAIRMIFAGEDALAVHILVQAAERQLNDLAKARGAALTFDWDSILKPETKKEFFEVYRELYDFLRHANRHPEKKMPIHDLAGFDVIGLLWNIWNYESLFGEGTDHMVMFKLFALNALPDVHSLEKFRANEAIVDGFRGLVGFELSLLIKAMVEVGTARQFWRFERERSEDTSELAEFLKRRAQMPASLS